MKQQTTATLKYAKMSPRKARLLIDLVRGMRVGEAMQQLQFSEKSLGLPLLKLLRSAVANAEHNHNIDKESLMVKTAFVDNGPIQYRWTPRAHGRASPIRKRTAHVTIILEGDVDEKKPKAKSQKPKGEESESKETVTTEETVATEEKKTKKKVVKTAKNIRILQSEHYLWMYY
jgi:large subunit ribosomal protein L22